MYEEVVFGEIKVGKNESLDKALRSRRSNVPIPMYLENAGEILRSRVRRKKAKVARKKRRRFYWGQGKSVNYLKVPERKVAGPVVERL